MPRKSPKQLANEKVVRVTCSGTEMVDIDDLTPFQGKFKKLAKGDYEKLRAQIIAVGVTAAATVWKDGDKLYLLDGHQRRETLSRMKIEGFDVPPIPVNFADCRTKAEAKIKVLALASTYGSVDPDGLIDFAKEAGLDMRAIADSFRFPDIDLEELARSVGASMLASGGIGETAAKTLAERFGVPPFSVLDARQGYWQSRKAAWLALGIKSEVGRGENLLKMSDTILQPDPKRRSAKVFGTSGNIAGEQTETSIFDPVLCELVYRWFCPKGGHVLDPFAGGSVRGVVASKLGLAYSGVDLRQEQVDANRAQAAKICKEGKKPDWKTGDSSNLPKIFPGFKADLVFSCPPYFDLEKYSDDEKDLSGMEWAEFKKAYKIIIANAAGMLKEDSFACFVVGDIRDKKGFYRNFVLETIQAFEEAGCKFYNDAVLVTAVGTLAIRAGKMFEASRKLGKAHQNVLIFFKGDPKKIRERLPKVEVALPMDGKE